ncbi:MAG: di-trans,poly-cis-decaprenylcistransferase [Deltaproteobacteria bacterium]|jgi:undecaprenyl diphosphate synthase|nr:di-trans,poly-cis-decaprenylcistransferase [Deltaproteobacteria bacterium]
MTGSQPEERGPEGSRIPGHVAIIMDGNGRWAEARGLPRSEGHKAGAEPVREILKAAHSMGIAFLTLYTFSSENWHRDQSEVDRLFTLLVEYLDSETEELLREGVRLNAVGDLEKLPRESRKALADAMRATRNNRGVTLTLALSYGSRAEMVRAARLLSEKTKKGETSPQEVDEDLFRSLLWTGALPDVDLLIRTGGEKRVSNFLLWHLVYAELYFTDTLWPDFTPGELSKAVEDFAARTRRFGR